MTKTTNLQTEILSEFIFENKDIIFTIEDFQGRAKGYYKKHIKNFCHLIAECLTHTRNHHKVTNTYDIGGTSYLKKRFNNSEAFKRMNEKCQVFLSTCNYSVGHYNMAYLIQNDFIERLSKVLVVNTEIDTSKFNKCPAYKPSSYDDVSYIIPSIESLSSAIGGRSLFPKERLFCWSLRESYKLHDNKIPQYYVRGKKSNRLFTRGPLGCQSLPKQVRDLVLTEYNEIDLSAAAYTILLNLAKEPNKYPVIQEYVMDVKKFRSDIASATDATVDNVKLTFLHKSFGSSLTFKSGIAELISETVLNQIRQNKLFESFCNEYRNLCKELYLYDSVLLEKCKVSRERYDEEHIYAGRYKGNYRSTYIACLYQKYEILIIQCIRDLLVDRNDCLLLHDAIFTKENLDIIEIERIVKEKIGIEIKIG
jgi:hypothetical protein